MAYTVENAVIMAAGFASRFVPLSYETPKGLLRVRGEVLIERQIRQLREAGIGEILVVTGYKADQFAYLKDAFGVTLVPNPAYDVRNNHASLYAVRESLGNTYICSSDNYFAKNPFTATVDDAYYAAVFSEGETPEWCLTADADGYIDSVQIGGCHAWYMLGHAFWSAPFSRAFVRILEQVYDEPQTSALLWESIYMQHLDVLKMKIRQYPPDVIYEFDTLDELRVFDASYLDDTRSDLVRTIARRLGCREREMTGFRPVQNADERAFSFLLRGKEYCVRVAAQDKIDILPQ